MRFVQHRQVSKGNISKHNYNISNEIKTSCWAIRFEFSCLLSTLGYYSRSRISVRSFLSLSAISFGRRISGFTTRASLLEFFFRVLCHALDGAQDLLHEPLYWSFARYSSVPCALFGACRGAFARRCF